MKRKRPSKTQIVLLAVLCLTALHFLFFRAPSEVEMINKFHQRKTEFEQIRLMLKQDKNVETIGNNWVIAKYGDKNGEQPDGVDLHELPLNISPSRIALYRSRLKKLGFFRVDSYNGRVQLQEFGGGFADTTWGIGYVWSNVTPTPLVKSAYDEMPMRGSRHFSHLEGKWYIYHRR